MQLAMNGLRRELPGHLAHLTVQDTWARIDEWLARRFPALASRLAPPASEKEIEDLERALGLPLPEDYRASLRIHAGGEVHATRDGSDVYSVSPFAGVRLLAPPVLLARRSWLARYASLPCRETPRVSASVRRAYHHDGWIPIAEGDEDRALYFCIDTVPASPDAHAQIVCMLTNDPDREAPWASFRAFLISELLVPIASSEVDEEATEDAGAICFA
jgi:molybdopterin molybdotransferase